MIQTIFVDYAVLNEKTANIIRQLQEYNEIVVFSFEREQNRLAFEERIMEFELGADELVMRAEDDFTKSVDLALMFVIDVFKGHDERALEQTAAVFCNNERVLERLREEGFFCVQTGWE